MKALNNQIITEPFNEKGVEAKINSGFASINQKSTIRGLRVILGNDTIPTGAYVALNAEAYVQQWAKKVYKQADMFGGQEFIIVPENSIIFWGQYGTKGEFNYPV